MWSKGKQQSGGIEGVRKLKGITSLVNLASIMLYLSGIYLDTCFTNFLHSMIHICKTLKSSPIKAIFHIIYIFPLEMTQRYSVLAQNKDVFAYQYSFYLLHVGRKTELAYFSTI